MVEGQTTDEISNNTGIRQGDSLSPALFNIIMDKLIESMDNFRGYKIGNSQIRAVCFADDAVLLANTEDDLQRLLYNFTNIAKTYNMEVSTAKTKSMVIAKEPIRCKLVVEEEIIEQVSSFQYLGIEIRVSSDRNLYKEVRQQALKGARISGYLRDITWKNKYLLTQSKVKIYKTVVRPTLTYGAETRAETSKTKQLLRTVEMNTLRAIIGKTRLDRVRNQTVRDECEVSDVVKFIKRRRVEWNNHVSRATNERQIKIARDERPRGKRNPGRPMKRWAESWQSTSVDTP